MKRLSFSVLIVFLFVLFACNNSQVNSPANFDPDQQAQDGKFKDGEHSVYFENGKLKYLVTYKDGKPNGQVKQFYEDGKLYMEATFKDGRRDGKCSYFYKNGKLHSVSGYVNGSREGEETKYWEGGELLSVCPYKNDKVQPGLKEYRKDGTLIVNTVEIVVKASNQTAPGGKHTLKVSLNNPEIQANYYVSAFPVKAPRVKLATSGYSGIYEAKLPENSNVKEKLVFEAEYKTQHGNTMRLQKIFDLSGVK